MSGNFKYRHHVEPRVKTLLAERVIIHHSTEVRRFQNCSYEFGCQASKRNVRSLDRFHSFHSIGRKTSRRIYVFRGGLTRRQLTSRPESSMGRALGQKMGKHAKLKERQKWSDEKLHLDNARKLRGICFH